MIAKQTVQRAMDSIASITGADIEVRDIRDELIASSGGESDLKSAERLTVEEDEQIKYTVAAGGDNAEMAARLAAAELKELLTAYQSRFDTNGFFQNLLLDNLLLVDIYQRARKLKIEDKVRRVIYVIEVKMNSDASITDYLNGMFNSKTGDYVTAVDENSVIVIKSLTDADDQNYMDQVASSIIGMLNAEVMVSARVAYGTPVGELRDLSKSYKEAMLALDVGRIFYEEKHIVAYSTLGIGRLIYQLPANLCRVFINEVFGGVDALEMDEETRVTIDTFYENSLNVSETARKLFVHRNTLVYRLDKLQKDTGLDIRGFDDALTLKISLMVHSYLKYMDGRSF